MIIMRHEDTMELKEQAIPHLCGLVADTLKVSRDAVNLDSGPLTLPQWDSFNHLHLVVAVEERYKIELGVDEIATMISVKDIMRILQEKRVVAR